MKVLDQDVVYKMIVSALRAHDHRVRLNGFSPDEIDKTPMNIKYVYAFPIDNETEDRRDFNNSTQSFADYFNEKPYLYTISKFNSNISDDYMSYNMNTTLVFIPEWIDFDSQSFRTKIKLSHDISYSKVYYGKDIGSLTNMIYSSIGLERDDNLIKALKNDFAV